jgi:hypothetical protein
MIYRLEEENERLKDEFELQLNNLKRKNLDVFTESNQKGLLLKMLKEEL